MTKVHAGPVVLVALSLAIACDSGSRTGETTAPSMSASGVPSVGRGEDAQGFAGPRQIAMRDDCDPRDPAWAPTGGCLLRRGTVTFGEFNAEMNSALSASVVGHQAWRNDPSYLKVEEGKSIPVRNEGGRVHTFTEVAMFGGGRVPPLSRGLVFAPECATAANVAPGETIHISNLGPGNHRFQCCIHPWMRAIIKVDDDAGGGDHSHD